MSQPNWYPSNTNVPLITEFILWFSRYEYALKQVPGFYKTTAGYLEPDWNRLKLELRRTTNVPADISNELAFLNAQPPRKQIDVGVWIPITFRYDWDLIISSLKTIRNNLFHGGKYSQGNLLNSDRDQDLVLCCTAIMKSIINVCPLQIQKSFWN